MNIYLGPLPGPRKGPCNLIIIIVIINCNLVVTRWQWLLYMYTKYTKRSFSSFSVNPPVSLSLEMISYVNKIFLFSCSPPPPTFCCYLRFEFLQYENKTKQNGRALSGTNSDWQIQRYRSQLIPSRGV